MRYFLLLFLGVFVTFSCVKTPSTDPVPVIEYKDVPTLQKTNLGNGVFRDTAVMILGYADGDGDLFRDTSKDPPNLIYWTLAFNPDSNKFIMDGSVSATRIIQPADGYYKGKPIHGDIYVPMGQFRSSDKIRTLKFEAFIVDMKGHKSNVVTSPAFTINF